MSKLPKPLGLKPPQVKLIRPLETVSENELNHVTAAPLPVSRVLAASRLKRRSKSVTDLRSIVDRPLTDFRALKLHLQGKSKPQSENRIAAVTKTLTSSKGVPKTTVTTRSGVAGAKRPLGGAKSSDEGASKPKVAKKIPDWDYKARFNQLTEKYINAQESIKEMKEKMREFEDFESNYAKVEEELKELTKVKESLATKCEELSSRNEILKMQKDKLEWELEVLENKHEKLTSDFKEVTHNLEKLTDSNEQYSKENKRLTDSLEELKCFYDKVQLEHCKFSKDLEEKYTYCKDRLQYAQAERRFLHNTIQDLKGNIRVFCRVRPAINNDEMERLQCSINFIDENGIEIRKSRESVSQITGKVQEQKGEFTFDKVFTMDSTQEEIFEDLSQLVQSALDGYDVCVFAYGQTGSGKTYTMQGGDSPAQKGMVPRTIDLIFKNISDLQKLGWNYEVEASFLEIYNESVRDLLNINSSNKLDIYFNEGKETIVSNLTIQHITSALKLTEFMRTAHRNRATAATNFNEHSSRSHAVTKIYLQGSKNDQNTLFKGSINLVDLAGSESAKTTSSGERLTETKNINKSLSTLGDVISALHNKSKHIPYRNSKLTYLLQSCLGGSSKTLMVVNIAPFEECFAESINSLRFAAKVKEVKTGSKRNKIALPVPLVKQISNLG